MHCFHAKPNQGVRKKTKYGQWFQDLMIMQSLEPNGYF